MNSLGVFYDVSLKKSNDLMNVFEEALIKTNNLMETMDNFNNNKIKKKNNNNEKKKKNNIINNEIRIRKLNKLKTYNQKKMSNKFQLKPIKNSNKYFKVREPYNYQKEYENELINQIETLFHPGSSNNSKDNTGMLSFLSPLIDSNLNKKNNEFYRSKDRINNAKINLDIKKEKLSYIKGQNSKKRLNNSMKKFDEKEAKKTNEKFLINKEGNKLKIPEIKRQIHKAKTNSLKEMYTLSKKNKNENNSNVDLLINKLKKKYS